MINNPQTTAPTQGGPAVGCSLMLLTFPLQVALAGPLQGLKGTEYSQLPQDLCQGYTDMLLGQDGPHEYGGVVCDREEGSYFLLQRLVASNPPHHSIWEILDIQALPKIKANELVLSEGCHHQQGSSDPIFAIVQTSNTSNIYQTQQAWTVSLAQATLQPVAAEQVTCRDPFGLIAP